MWDLLNFRVDDYDISSSKMASMASRFLGRFFPWVETWMNEIIDPIKNPSGFESFFNVPNDADDTAMATALLRLENGRTIDATPLHLITRYRDTRRFKFDSRDTWSSKNTGAFLTWLKDENLETFATPNSGVMPMGVNNVDCVVNANVLFSLALNDMKGAPGFRKRALSCGNGPV